MPLVNEQAEFLLDAVKLILKASEMGFTLTGGELYRSLEQQQIHFKNGRSKTMKSNHLVRCAIDLNFFKDGKLTYDKALLKPIGDYWESLNPKNRWGGNFNSIVDVPHFERNVQ
jgi:hypothetical protein